MTWVLDNLDLIGTLTVEHLRQSVPPILLGLVFALPIGWLAYRYRPARGLILGSTGLLYTIPSLALFAILPPLLGISFLSEANLIIAMTIYAVAIMTRSVSDALSSVSPDVRNAATGMGYGAWRRFWAVELPLAGPVILAGLRVTAVSTISLVTVGILIGVQNLGYLFTNGLQRRIIPEVLAGVIAVMAIALLIDLLLAAVGRRLMPWAPGGPQRRPSTQALEAT
jgi:osmoprotectant transport system permease protein